MDHEAALSTNAAERYVAGRMSTGEMNEFEEHYFTCLECATAVEECQMLFANGREAVRRESRAAVTAMPGFRRPAKTGWIQWGAIAATVCLTAALGYQYSVVYPGLKQDLAEARSPRYVQSVSLRGASRSQTAPPRAIPAGNRTLVLSFFPDAPVSEVEYELRSARGPVVVSGKLGRPPLSSTGECQIALTLDAGVAAGEYDAKVIGVEGTTRTVLGERRISVQ